MRETPAPGGNRLLLNAFRLVWRNSQATASFVRLHGQIQADASCSATSRPLPPLLTAPALRRTRTLQHPLMQIKAFGEEWGGRRGGEGGPMATRSEWPRPAWPTLGLTYRTHASARISRPKP